MDFQDSWKLSIPIVLQCRSCGSRISHNYFSKWPKGIKRWGLRRKMKRLGWIPQTMSETSSVLAWKSLLHHKPFELIRYCDNYRDLTIPLLLSWKHPPRDSLYIHRISQHVTRWICTQFLILGIQFQVIEPCCSSYRRSAFDSTFSWFIIECERLESNRTWIWQVYLTFTQC